MSTVTQAHKLSMPNQWARSCQFVSFKRGTNYSLTVIKAEYIQTDMHLEIYVTG